MEKFTTIEMNGRIHVITPVERNGNYKVYDPKTGDYSGEGEPIPQPNYKGTGKALCGVLRRHELLDTWISRKAVRAEVREEANG